MQFTVFPEGSPQDKHEVDAYEGDNLLDTLNDMNIQDLSVFGICEKGLACASCRVNFITNFKELNEPSEDEQDVLD